MAQSNNHIGISFEVDPNDEDQLAMPRVITDGQQLDDADRTPLSSEEKELLQQYIKEINDDLHTLCGIGGSLYQIKKRKLFRETHSSFEKFCEDTFDLSRSHAYRLASEYEVKQNFKDASPTATAIPDNTGKSRIVSGATKEEQLKVGQRVKQIAGDRPDTAKDWEQGKQELIDEGEIKAPAKPKKSKAAKTPPTPKAPSPKTTDAKPTLTIDPSLVPLKTLQEKAESYEKLKSDSKSIMEKARLWQEIKLGLQAWAAWEEQLNRGWG